MAVFAICPVQIPSESATIFGFDGARRQTVQATIRWSKDMEAPVRVIVRRKSKRGTTESSAAFDLFSPLEMVRFVECPDASARFLVASAQCMYEYRTYIWLLPARGKPRLALDVNFASIERLRRGIVLEQHAARFTDSPPAGAADSEIVRREWRFDRRTLRFTAGPWRRRSPVK